MTPRPLNAAALIPEGRRQKRFTEATCAHRERLYNKDRRSELMGTKDRAVSVPFVCAVTIGDVEQTRP